jgi:hypothetical protein
MATLSSGGSTHTEGVEAHPDSWCHATVHVAIIRESHPRYAQTQPFVCPHSMAR